MKTTFVRVIALSVCLGAAAQAAPRTISDCEKIEAADAYNQCLALFGPPARLGNMSTQDGAESHGARQVEPKEPNPAQEAAADLEASAKHGRQHSRHASTHSYRHGGGRHYAHHWRHRHVSGGFVTPHPA